MERSATSSTTAGSITEPENARVWSRLAIHRSRSAAAAALRDLGSSSALVCTPAFNVGAVATYRAAGFQPLPETRAQVRKA